MLCIVNSAISLDSPEIWRYVTVEIAKVRAAFADGRTDKRAFEQTDGIVDGVTVE